MTTHATGLRKFLGKVRSLAVVYNAEEEYYFAGGGMGVTNVGQHKMEIYDSKPNSKPSSNKVRIVRIEEVEFYTAFVGGLPVNKIDGLMKGENWSCNKYKTHEYREKGNVENAFYLTTNGTNLFLKPLISLIIGDGNQAFISQVGEDLYKDTSMAIMDKVNRTANSSTEGVEKVPYVRKFTTSGTEVIDELTNRDPGYPAKQMKTFLPPDMKTISDTVISRFITKLQVHLDHSAEVIVGDQASSPSSSMLWVLVVM